MSGLPARVLPWIAALLWDFTGTRLSRAEFQSLWESRVTRAAAAGAPNAARAWTLLVEAAGDASGRIDIRRLRTVLGRVSPPSLFCSPDFGDKGPIVGTIHASKGREAETVRLYLPPFDEKADGLEEEARVTFVGATRARTKLFIGESASSRAGSIDNGRVWQFSNQRIRVEIGRQGDLSAPGLAGKAFFGTEEAAKAAQKSWLETPHCTGLFARQQHALGWDYELCNSDGTRLCVLSSRFTEDMRHVANDAKRFPPANFFPHIRSVGLRSFVLAPDDPELQHLHEPWASSGFLFAPMLTGFSVGRFGRS